MSIEIELKLQLDAKTARALVKHPLLASQKPQTALLLNTYYDTPKLALHKRLIAVRYRKKGEQWLCTVKTAEPSGGGLSQRGEWEIPATPGSFEFGHVDNDRLRKFLEKRKGKLEPVFTTDFKRQTWEVAFGESHIELALDRGKIESCGRQEKICEIELELLTGKTADLFGLALELQKTLHLRPSIPSKAERGYNLFLNRPLAPFHAQPVAIHKKMPPIEAFRVIALNCLEQFQRNEAGILASDDPEFVHQARVAIRRLRTAFWLFRPLLPHAFVQENTPQWKSLAQALGKVRDWDVLLTQTLPAIELACPEDPLPKEIKAKARQQTSACLQSLRTKLTTPELSRYLLELTAESISLAPLQEPTLKQFARIQLARLRKKTGMQARNLGKLSGEERHRLRIRIKRLRYSCEFLHPLLVGQLKSDSLQKLARLQEKLGKAQDLVTAHRLVSGLFSGQPSARADLWFFKIGTDTTNGKARRLIWQAIERF